MNSDSPKTGNETSSQPTVDNSKTCPTCKHFIPYQDGAQDGRCTEFMGSYGSHTTHDHTCDDHKQA